MSCPVCFSGEDPVVRESVNAGIGVLLGVTVVVLGLFARFFVSLARRSALYEAQLRREGNVHVPHSPHSPYSPHSPQEGHEGREAGYVPSAVR